MIVRYIEIKDYIAQAMGLKDFDDAGDGSGTLTAKQKQIELRINQVQDWIVFDRLWDWRSRSYYFSSRPTYSTGTVTVTKGSRTVTGSGTSWVEDMRTGVIRIDNKFYKIDTIDSSTQLKLVAAYPKISASSQSYLIGFPTSIIHPEFSAITDIIHDGRTLNIDNKIRKDLNSVNVGEPYEAAITDRNNQILYNTGVVEMTNDSETVTGSVTAWTTDMEGSVFRVDEFAEDYVIKNVNSTTEIELDRPYRGTSGTGKTYQINPEGVPLLELHDVPDDYYFMKVEGLIRARKLVNDNDISIIPDHAPLLHGAAYLAWVDLEERNPVVIQQKRADFERTMKQLRDTYKTVTNVRWTDEREIQARKSGFIPRFDPLDDSHLLGL